MTQEGAAEAELVAVEVKIAAVERQLEVVEQQLAAARAAGDTAEVQRLSRKDERLGKKEERLGAEKLLLRQRQSGALPTAARMPARSHLTGVHALHGLESNRSAEGPKGGGAEEGAGREG